MPNNDDLQAVAELNEAYRLITDQLGRVIVGQQKVIEELLVAMFARGHCLLVGVPGLAKTLLIRTLADALSLEFRRIQFTPDLMPSDITGTEVIQEDKLSGVRDLRFLHGPIFGNIILADEINRTPPKTQAALLEAMQEFQITVGGKRHPLAQPFFVLATQNPIEQEGTYPLPEAQYFCRLSQRRGGIRHRQANDGGHYFDGRAHALGRENSCFTKDRSTRARGRSCGSLRFEAGTAHSTA
jgi:MoxR-like ATPase